MELKVGEWHCMYLGENTKHTVHNFKDKSYTVNTEETVLGTSIDYEHFL